MDHPKPNLRIIDAGGWFRSKHFLLPMRYARLNAAGRREAYSWRGCFQRE